MKCHVNPRLLLTIFVGFSLCVYFFFLMLPLTIPRTFPNDDGNAYWFTRLSHQSIEHYPAMAYAKQYPIHTSRSASQFISGVVWDMPRDPQIWNHFRFDALSISFGLYNTFWMALLFGLLIHYRRVDAVLLMLGTFAGLMYNLTLPGRAWVMPWDMPIMCLFTWSVLVFMKNEYFPLLILVFTASLFKETGLVCSILVLLGPWSRRKQILGFIGLILSFVVCRKFLMIASGSTAILVPLNEGYNLTSLVTNTLVQIKLNVCDTFSFHLNSPFFANCGMLFVMLFLPTKRAIKLMAAVFMVGQFIAGTVYEFRDFFELLPLGLMQLSDYLSDGEYLRKVSHETPYN